MTTTYREQANSVYESEQSLLQKKCRDLCLTINPEYFVTFTFRQLRGIDERRARKILGKFLRILRRRRYGRWARNKKIPIIPVIEGGRRIHHASKRKINIHIHCLIRLGITESEAKEMIRESWKSASDACGIPEKYCEDDEKWFIPLHSEMKQRIYSNYIVKTMKTNTDGLLVDLIST